MWQRAAIAAVAVAAAVALSIPVIRHFSEEPPPLRLAVRLSLAPPDGTELGAGDDVLDAAISPNQQEVVFVARRLGRSGAGDPPGSTQLWRRRFDSHRVPNRWPEPRARVSLPGSTPETSSHFLPQRG